jgi:dienelactone hydrolase
VKPLALVLLAAALMGSCASVEATGGRVRFPSLAEPTMVDGYLFRRIADGRHPAVVFLHGCGGLLSSTGQIQAREADWARHLVDQGYVVLMVDSFSPRGITAMCSPDRFNLPVYLERPKDAYGALRYLQAQPFVRPDRVGVIGWSQGGGVVLLSIRDDSLGRPPETPLGDFRAAVAFYPSACAERAHRRPWTSTIPLLVLVGDGDNWTPAEPCRGLVDAAVRRGADARIHVYADSYHDFDWPGLPIRSRPEFRTASGVVPMVGMSPAAREDALKRVPEFLGRHLKD